MTQGDQQQGQQQEGQQPSPLQLLGRALALRPAALCRASMFPRTRLSAVRIRPSILRSASF